MMKFPIEATDIEQKTEKPKGKHNGSKPIVEKKRRKRINDSLEQLRKLVVRDNKEKRIEKADILKMTVRYIQEEQERHPQKQEVPVQVIINCVNQMSKDLAMDKELEKKIAQYLRSKMQQHLNNLDSKPSPKIELPAENSAKSYNREVTKSEMISTEPTPVVRHVQPHRSKTPVNDDVRSPLSCIVPYPYSFNLGRSTFTQVQQPSNLPPPAHQSGAYQQYLFSVPIHQHWHRFNSNRNEDSFSDNCATAPVYQQFSPGYSQHTSTPSPHSSSSQDSNLPPAPILIQCPTNRKKFELFRPYLSTADCSSHHDH